MKEVQVGQKLLGHGQGLMLSCTNDFGINFKNY